MVDSLIRREVHFASIPANINLIEALVEELKVEFSMSEEMVANILVSLSEAVNNAIHHGNKLSASKKVKLKMIKNENTLTFSVEDSGPGFNPESIRDPTTQENIDKPTGRGIFLMRNLADKVEFFDGGKKVVITFFLN